MNIKKPLILALISCAALFSGVAKADHFGYHGGYHGGWHGNFGVYLGAPYPYPYYPYPYAYPVPAYPPVVVTPAQPQIYIEQGATGAAPSAPPAQNYWYHCDNPDGYYPYIKECPGGWKAVAPTPPTLQAPAK